MKARVKGTNNIIDVEFDKGSFNEGYPPYREKEYNMFYQPEQLEWVDNEENADPDYWTRLEHQYAGMAMQGMLNNSLLITSLLKVNKSHEDIVAEVTGTAIRYAHTLVKKVRYEENPKELEGLKRELEALKIEKTILENKIKLLKEERK